MNELPKKGDLIAGKYTVEGVLGQGGMGAVFEVCHRLTGKRFAVKWLLPALTGHSDAVRRFMREAQVDQGREVGGVALLSGAASCSSFTAAQPAAVRRIERIIDAHCHLVPTQEAVESLLAVMAASGATRPSVLKSNCRNVEPFATTACMSACCARCAA